MLSLGVYVHVYMHVHIYVLYMTFPASLHLQLVPLHLITALPMFTFHRVLIAKVWYSMLHAKFTIDMYIKKTQHDDLIACTLFKQNLCWLFSVIPAQSHVLPSLSSL